MVPVLLRILRRQLSSCAHSRSPDDLDGYVRQLWRIHERAVMAAFAEAGISAHAGMHGAAGTGKVTAVGNPGGDSSLESAARRKVLCSANQQSIFGCVHLP